MTPLRRVAILSPAYPPNQTPGSLRAGKFAKYLPHHGWEPIVITVRPGSDLYVRAGPLPDELSAGRVYRTRDLSLATWLYRGARTLARAAGRQAARVDDFQGSPRRAVQLAYRLYRHWICFPDECWPWRFEYGAIRRIVERERPRVLLSSSPPATAHLLAARLGRELGLPWVADLRDAWSRGHIHVRSRLLRRLETRLERRTLRGARALVTVSEPLRAALAEEHAKPVRLVPNGYDEDDLPRGAGAAHRAPPGRLLLVYTGLLYPRERDPAPVFQALSAMIAAREVKPDEILIRLFGRNLVVAAEALRRFPALAGSVEVCGEVAHADALAWQSAAHGLLSFGSTAGEARGIVTCKLFEYLAAGRPVLALAPRGGEVDRVLRETGGGGVVTSVEEVRAALGQWIEEFRRTGRVVGPGPARPQALARYTRRRVAGDLAAVLDEVAGGTA